MIEEVKKYHRDTLVRCVEELNKKEAAILGKRKTARRGAGAGEGRIAACTRLGEHRIYAPLSIAMVTAWREVRVLDIIKFSSRYGMVAGGSAIASSSPIRVRKRLESDPLG